MAEASRTSTSTSSNVESGSIDELTRMFALFLKYQGVPQGALIHDLSAAGLSVSRIAELIQIAPNTVSVTKRRPRPAWPLT